jgi:hypothetical protein
MLNEFFWFILATIFHKNNRGQPRECECSNVVAATRFPQNNFLLLWSRGDDENEHDVKDRACAS